MSARALEFVELWVADKIEQAGYPLEGDAAVAKQWAAACRQAAIEEGIPNSEIDEAFDDLAEFIEGEIEEARERDEDEDEDNDKEFDDEDEEEDDEDQGTGAMPLSWR